MDKPKRANVPKRYTIIVKVNEDILPGNQPNCKKWHDNDLLKFLKFLDRDWPEWVWFKVYSNNQKLTGRPEKEQLGYFNKNNRPLTRYI